MRAKDINFSGETIGKIKVVRLIGQGNWADVYLAENVDTQQKLAIKTTSNKKFIEVPKLRELVQAEINILKSCNNINVVKLVDSFQYKDHQFIVLQYCNGLELGDVLGKEKKIDELTAIIYLKHILNGFKGLHEVRAMHRDFKVENVMLHDEICKIVDLGFGKQGQVAKTKLGSNLTMAPQVMQGLSYDFKVDIWSIGVVYYQLLYGTFPFQARSAKGLLQMTRKHQFSLQGQKISQLSKDFITKCLVFNPEERISWTEIYRHPLIADKSQEINLGPANSQVNVQQNASFYEILQESLKKSVAPPPALAEERSSMLPQLRKTSELDYPMFESVDMKRIEEMKYVPQLDFKQKTQEEEKDEQFSFGESKIYERQEMKQVVRDYKSVQGVRYFYQRKIENIRFMSNFVQHQLELFQSKQLIAKIFSILCLLQKQSYIELLNFKEELCLNKNYFNISKQQFDLFIKEDNTIAWTINQHLESIKQLYEVYKANLQQINRQKYLEIKQMIERISIEPKQCKQWYTFFNKSFKGFIQQIYHLLNFDNMEDRKRLQKLSFCISWYIKFNKSGDFKKQILLGTLKKFDYVTAGNNLQQIVKQRQSVETKHQSFKKQEVKKNISPTNGFFSSATYYSCPFGQI